jgi:hypothetical protein
LTESVLLQEGTAAQRTLPVCNYLLVYGGMDFAVFLLDMALCHAEEIYLSALYTT